MHSGDLRIDSKLLDFLTILFKPSILHLVKVMGGPEIFKGRGTSTFISKPLYLSLTEFCRGSGFKLNRVKYFKNSESGESTTVALSLRDRL